MNWFRVAFKILLAVLVVASLTLVWPMMDGRVDAAVVYSYTNMPLECNAQVPYVSTYDQATVGGKTYYHGLSLDFPAASGVKVVTPAAGTAYVRYDGGYGNYVDVVEPGGKTHRMAHLQGVGLVGNGTPVFKGQVVGLVGSTGASTGPHLHYEQRVGGAQVAIALEGPALAWGARYTSDGDRQTTHALKSVNCIGANTAPAAGSSGAVGVAGWSDGNMVLSRASGGVGRGWTVAVPKVSNPALSDACNFDGDAATEAISYESNLKQFVMANPRGDGTMAWSVVLKGIYSISDFACVDWNADGKSDIWARDGSNNAVYVGYSNGAVVSQWVRQKSTTGAWAAIGDPEFVEGCDINGDARDEIVVYEANARFMLGRPSGSGAMRWDLLLGGVANIDATACGNFNTTHAGAELIGWQILNGKGTYLIGEFASSFAHERWDALTPNGLGVPYMGELDAGNIDGDGTSELLAHEYRGGVHFVMVADFTGARSFRWYQYAQRGTMENMTVGRFG
jgi:hypothetical protein